MKTIVSFAIVLSLAACGNKSAPPSEPAPATGDTGAPTNAEECEAAGHTVVGDIGDGQVKCPDGMEEVSRIQYGIEGGVCCKPASGGTPPAAP